MQEGYFSGVEIKTMFKTYFSKEEQKEMITTAQIWEKRGEKKGEKRGEKQGKQNQARLTILRGYAKNHNIESLAELVQMPMKEALVLGKSYEIIKQAWDKKEIDKKALEVKTKLSLEEIDSVLLCLESVEKLKN